MNQGVHSPEILLNLSKVTQTSVLLRNYSGYLVTRDNQLSFLVNHRKKFPVIKKLYLRHFEVNNTDEFNKLLKDIDYLTYEFEEFQENFPEIDKN